MHAVADDPPYSVMDEPERDDAGRFDTTCDGIELPTDLLTRLRDSESCCLRHARREGNPFVEPLDQFKGIRSPPKVVPCCWPLTYRSRLIL